MSEKKTRGLAAKQMESGCVMERQGDTPGKPKEEDNARERKCRNRQKALGRDIPKATTRVLKMRRSRGQWSFSGQKNSVRWGASGGTDSLTGKLPLSRAPSPSGRGGTPVQNSPRKKPHAEESTYWPTSNHPHLKQRPIK